MGKVLEYFVTFSSCISVLINYVTLVTTRTDVD